MHFTTMAKGDGPIPDKNGKTIRRNENAQKPEGKGKGIHTFGPPPCSGRNRTGIAAVSHETDTGRRRKIAEMSVPGPVCHAACPVFFTWNLPVPVFPPMTGAACKVRPVRTVCIDRDRAIPFDWPDRKRGNGPAHEKTARGGNAKRHANFPVVSCLTVRMDIFNQLHG